MNNEHPARIPQEQAACRDTTGGPNSSHQPAPESDGRFGTCKLVASDGAKPNPDSKTNHRDGEILEQVIHAVAQAVFWKDRQSVFLGCNETFARFVGFETAEQVKGKTDYDFPYANIRADAYRKADREVVDQKKTLANIIESVRQADGTDRWVSTTKTPLMDSEGNVCGVVGIFEDITERKRAQAQQQKLETQMQQVQKLESLGVLAGGIAHDFNNLLMCILGNADLALADLPPMSPGREHIREIERASRRAADLCRQMLAYSGKGRFVVEDVSLSELVEEMVHLLRTSISKKAILNLNLEKILPHLRGDSTQVRQIVMNLVINASEAIGERSGVITISTGAMECTADYLREAYLDDNLRPGFYVWLEVSDTGCGMDQSTVHRIFEPFFTTKFAGRGLGLSAVLGIVRSHKGALKVYSEPGKGTTFKVLFPASEESVETRKPSRQGNTERRFSGTVLLVDDEETIRATGKMMLERMGYTVLVASDGREAIKMYPLHRDKISVVLLDLTMPHLNGEETFRELRQMNPQVRVIMSSGYSETDISSRFAGKGLAGVIQKPYTRAELTQCLSAAVPECQKQ